MRNGGVAVAQGDIIRFRLDGVEGDQTAIPLPHPEIFEAVLPNQHLLIDDGRIRVEVTGLEARCIEARALVGGILKGPQGRQPSRNAAEVSPLTRKDREDLAFGLDLGVDWVALSFVQTPSDVIEAKALIGDRAGLTSKIEKPSALEKIDDIVRLSDGIMVARGDMGVELSQEEVPGRQKELIRACREAGKPVIVATQMLESMVSSPTPTRAEASDVATAIFDGADAVMLSAESATGQYPVETVQMMDRIIRNRRSTASSALWCTLRSRTRKRRLRTPSPRRPLNWLRRCTCSLSQNRGGARYSICRERRMISSLSQAWAGERLVRSCQSREATFGFIGIGGATTCRASL